MSYTFYHALSDSVLRILPGTQQLNGMRKDTLTLESSAFAVYQQYDTAAAKQAIANAVKELEQKRRRSKQHTRDEE